MFRFRKVQNHNKNEQACFCSVVDTENNKNAKIETENQKENNKLDLKDMLSTFEELGFDSDLIVYGQYVIQKEKASIGMLQREFKIGFNRASRIMDNLCKIGVVSEEYGTKPRDVLLTEEEFKNLTDTFYRFEEIIKNEQKTRNKQIYNEAIQNQELKTDYDFMTGNEFEYFCANILSKNDFYDIEVTQASGDQGVDIIAYRDRVKFGIQCKCYSSFVGNSSVQEAYSGSMFYDCHVPVVMSNQYFTQSAINLSEKIKVVLWDRDQLNKMIEKAK